MADPFTRFHLRPAETRVGRLALLTMDNGEDSQKPNVFGREALESLQEALRRIGEGEWAGLVLTGKPFVFAAGADIANFPSITAELAREGGRAGHELFGAIRALPFPTLAAVNGAALGGGVEIALHCDHRTISSGVRHFACPEVFLGLIPGWGGTQLVPRLVGAAQAVKFVVSNPLRQNRMLTGPQAFEAGFADALLDPVEFLDESIEWLVAAIERGEGKRERAADLSDAAEVCRKARLQVDDAVHGASPAPYRAIDLIEGAATWTLEEGYRAEEDALAELLPGPEAQASIYAFDLVERRAKRGVGVPEAAPRRVTRVGIAGAGLMATQLATLFLRRLEVPIVITDVDQGRVDAALETVRDAIGAEVAKGRYTEGKGRFLAGLVSGGVGVELFAGCDLVLEAVFEEMAVKKELFASLEQVVSPECVLATNTSSLSVTDMASDLEHPGRVVGMHFFNPVALMPLLELVRAEQTDDATLATAWAVSQKLRKRGVVVGDGPGFVVNRLLARQSTVLMDALEHGSSVEETDEAAFRIGLPMAPSVLLGLVGPRVALHTLESMHAAFPDRFPLSMALQALADGSDEISVVEHAPRSVAEIHDAILEALADEIRHLLDEGVVASPKDVDTCLLLGAGFPFFRGGITPHLDATGIAERVAGGDFAATA